VRDEETPLRIVAEHLPQLRDIDTDDLCRRSRRLTRPECSDDRVERDDLVSPDQQQREQSPLLRRAEDDHTVTGSNLERPEQPELHTSF